MQCASICLLVSRVFASTAAMESTAATPSSVPITAQQIIHARTAPTAHCQPAEPAPAAAPRGASQRPSACCWPYWIVSRGRSDLQRPQQSPRPCAALQPRPQPSFAWQPCALQYSCCRCHFTQKPNFNNNELRCISFFMRMSLQNIMHYTLSSDIPYAFYKMNYSHITIIFSILEIFHCNEMLS